MPGKIFPMEAGRIKAAVKAASRAARWHEDWVICEELAEDWAQKNRAQRAPKVPRRAVSRYGIVDPQLRGWAQMVRTMKIIRADLRGRSEEGRWLRILQYCSNVNADVRLVLGLWPNKDEPLGYEAEVIFDGRPDPKGAFHTLPLPVDHVWQVFALRDTVFPDGRFDALAPCPWLDRAAQGCPWRPR